MRSGFFAAAAALSMGAAALPVKAAEGRVVLAPAKGQSFAVGGEKAVGYFLAKDGQCELTLTVAPAGDADAVKGAGQRLRFAVAPGSTGQFETAEGGALQFTCGSGAKSMSVAPFERVAYADMKSN